MIKNNKTCYFCGKPAAVFYKNDMLCDNCWKGIKWSESQKFFVKPKGTFKFKDLAK